mmetsp:Transcript_70206/g.227758  ORF Transcript_70206/g.227758 Transcript_70206/m.227758 type:complete len:157 (+) Transcript_70206:208-678(+)
MAELDLGPGITSAIFGSVIIVLVIFLSGKPIDRMASDEEQKVTNAGEGEAPEVQTIGISKAPPTNAGGEEPRGTVADEETKSEEEQVPTSLDEGCAAELRAVLVVPNFDAELSSDMREFVGQRRLAHDGVPYDALEFKFFYGKLWKRWWLEAPLVT